MNSSDGVMAKLEVPPLDGIGDYFEIELIKIDSSVIMNEIQYMSSGITRATLDVMRGNSNQNPIYDVQTLGDDMLKYTHSYFSKSTKLLYEQVTSAAESAYTMSSLISLARGTIKGLVARNKQRAVTAAREKNSARKNSLNRSNARLSALNKFGGMIFDPIEHLIEFSLAVAKAVISVYLPLGNGLAVVYFTAGLILAAYIPFAPMLIYTFSVLAWIFSVIEAMIAAPIVMIGFANPEGHEMLGKTEQAIMLLVGVFIRPFITLIGFMLSMLMSFSLIKLFNSMMLVSSLFFFKNLLQADIDLSIAIMFGIAGLVVLYAYSLMVIMQQCYSMIYVIPDQILKWIGGPAESAGSGVAQVMRSVQTGLSQQSQSAASGVTSAAGGSVQISTKN
jgi:conjugal transfer/type IV secretion protein DotA/TraY